MLNYNFQHHSTRYPARRGHDAPFGFLQRLVHHGDPRRWDPEHERPRHDLLRTVFRGGVRVRQCRWHGNLPAPVLMVGIHDGRPARGNHGGAFQPHPRARRPAHRLDPDVRSRRHGTAHRRLCRYPRIQRTLYARPRRRRDPHQLFRHPRHARQAGSGHCPEIPEESGLSPQSDIPFKNKRRGNPPFRHCRTAPANHIRNTRQQGFNSVKSLGKRWGGEEKAFCRKASPPLPTFFPTTQKSPLSNTGRRAR